MIFSNPLIGIFQVTFVILFVIRTVRKYSSVNSRQKNVLTKIGTAFVFIAAIISILASPSSLIFFLPSMAVFLCPILLDLYLKKRLEQQCHSGLPKMIDSMILEMYRGSSFKLARSKALQYLPFESQCLVTKAFSKNSIETNEISSFLPEIVHKSVTELIKIEQSSSNQLGRLKHFRDHMYSQQDFRHKSGQALLQTRIQSLLILILYVLVLIFSLFQHPWPQLKPFFFISAAMLGTGLLSVHLITRKRKWKT